MAIVSLFSSNSVLGILLNNNILGLIPRQPMTLGSLFRSRGLLLVVTRFLFNDGIQLNGLPAPCAVAGAENCIKSL